MKLEQSFEVDAPLERVWQTLIDVEHVAPCLPGALVTGRNEDGSYNGTFTVKIGPTTASYSGKLEMETIDEASHSATMQAQGTDKRGQGGAKATIFSRLEPSDGRGTRVEVVTDYHITGRLARFGRGGMIEDISERLLREFAKRLQSSLSAQRETVVSQAVAAASEARPRRLCPRPPCPSRRRRACAPGRRVRAGPAVAAASESPPGAPVPPSAVSEPALAVAAASESPPGAPVPPAAMSEPALAVAAAPEPPPAAPVPEAPAPMAAREPEAPVAPSAEPGAPAAEPAAAAGEPEPARDQTVFAPVPIESAPEAPVSPPDGVWPPPRTVEPPAGEITPPPPGEAQPEPIAVPEPADPASGPTPAGAVPPPPPAAGAGAAAGRAGPGGGGSARQPPARPPPPGRSPGPPPVVAPPPAPEAPPQPRAGATRPALEHPPSEPIQGLTLVGGVLWSRVKRNPAPAAAAGVAVMLLLARRRRRRH